jgi:hypothetical protein
MKKFPVFSLMIWEFDSGEQFASDCIIRQAVHDFWVLGRKLENSRMFARFLRCEGTGEAEIGPSAAD